MSVSTKGNWPTQGSPAGNACRPESPGKLAEGVSFLADIADIDGLAQIPLKQPHEPRSLASFSSLSLVLEDNRYVHPGDMDDQKVELEQRWARIEEAEHFAQKVRLILDCDKTYRVLEALADGLIKQVEIATLLGRKDYQISREVKRLHKFIRDNWDAAD